MLKACNHLDAGSYPLPAPTFMMNRSYQWRPWSRRRSADRFPDDRSASNAVVKRRHFCRSSRVVAAVRLPHCAKALSH